MKHDIYDLTESLERMTRILEGNGEDYMRYPFIPDDDTLKGCRGSYTECVVLTSRLYFKERSISILNLAKIYDVFLKEGYAIMSSNQLCKEVLFHGNIMTAIFNVGGVGFMDELLDVAGRISSLPDVINVRIGRKEKPLIGNVCAMDKGYQFALAVAGEIKYFGGMISKMEEWINKPAAGEEELRGLYISKRAAEILKEDYKGFFKESEIEDVLHGKVANVGMAAWIKEHK